MWLMAFVPAGLAALLPKPVAEARSAGSVSISELTFNHFIRYSKVAPYYIFTILYRSESIYAILSLRPVTKGSTHVVSRLSPG